MVLLWSMQWTAILISVSLLYFPRESCSFHSYNMKIIRRMHAAFIFAVIDVMDTHIISKLDYSSLARRLLVVPYLGC